MISDRPKLNVIEVGREPQREPRLRWGDGYKVTEIGTEGRTHDLPGKTVYLSKQEVLENRNTLVFGERGSGNQDFLNWWRNALDNASKPRAWVLVNAADWQGDFFKWSEGPKDIARDKEKKYAEEAIVALGQKPDAISRAQALSQWAKGLNKPFTLIIRNLMALGEEQAMEVATALRRINEQRDSKLNIVISSTSESIFADLADRSGYRTLCHQYRLPTLEKEEIDHLAGWSSPDKETWPALRFEDLALEAFLKQTGGQPLLVQHLLRRLQLIKPLEQESTTSAQVESAARQMRASPPDQVRFWQEDLKRLLAAELELIHSMESYVLGKTLGPVRFPPPSYERALFIAGWVRLNPLGRWGTSSSFHTHLARPILDGFRRRGR